MKSSAGIRCDLDDRGFAGTSTRANEVSLDRDSISVGILSDSIAWLCDGVTILIHKKSVYQLQGKQAVNLGCVVSIAVEMAVNYRLDTFAH